MRASGTEAPARERENPTPTLRRDGPLGRRDHERDNCSQIEANHQREYVVTDVDSGSRANSDELPAA